ncbi:MAG: ABC transporter permease [Bacteroides sp.]|nr:ABC transporter permease [Bacteroides sp.]
MYSNYLKIIFRTISKNIVYVLINVLGLGLALAICIVAFLNYRFDADFDSSHLNGANIFRIEHTRLTEGSQISYASTPGPLGPAMLEDVSGIEKMVRLSMDLMSNVQLLKAGENETFTRLIYADPEFFDVFTFPLNSGSNKSFRDNNSIFITRQLAVVLFGDRDPIGEIISVWDAPYTVGAVLENHPLNSSFSFEAVVPISNFFKKNSISEYKWGNFVSSTFILLNDQNQINAIERSLQKYVPHINDVSWSQVEDFYLASFKDMAHKGRSINNHSFRPSIHPAAVIPPLIAAIFILIIACFNIISSSIAVAGKRLKEIGVRKVAGSLQQQLVLQFMGENILLVFFALIFSLFFAHFLVPSYSGMWDFMNLSFSLSGDPVLWIFIAMILIATAILAGAYPAFYISSFKPANIFQDKLKLGGRNLISKGILILQFSISILALFLGIAFIQNADYQDNFDLGFDGDHLIEVHGNSDVLAIFKNSIQGNPKIENISEAVLAPFFNDREIRIKDLKIQAKMRFLEMEAFNTMGFRLLDGRPFERKSEKTDEITSILVNRKFVEELGLYNPVGKNVVMGDSVHLNIIGVMENLMEEGVFTTKISPVFYRLVGDNYKTSALWIRVAPENRQAVQRYLHDQWDKVVPDIPYLGIDGNIFQEASEYINRKILAITIFLILISTVLSVAGCYSQVSLRIIHRTREVGIRKIFGASISRVIRILSYEYILQFVMGSLIGSIAGYYLTMKLMALIWEYSTDLTIVTFILPTVILFTVILITLYGKVYTAASRNPAISLRHE